MTTVLCAQPNLINEFSPFLIILGFYKPNDKIVKRVTGSIDKPKRRRGRPSRPPQDVLLAQQREADEKAENEKRLAEMLAAAEADSPGRKRRNIKKPSRFKEVVQVYFDNFVGNNFNAPVVSL